MGRYTELEEEIRELRESRGYWKHEHDKLDVKLVALRKTNRGLHKRIDRLEDELRLFVPAPDGPTNAELANWIIHGFDPDTYDDHASKTLDLIAERLRETCECEGK